MRDRPTSRGERNCIARLPRNALQAAARSSVTVRRTDMPAAITPSPLRMKSQKEADRAALPAALAAAAGAAGNAARSASFWLFILSGLGVIAAGISVRRTVTEERAAACNAFLGSRAIQFRSPRLVGRSLIPIHAQPFQAVDNALDEFRLVTLGVGVLDAQDHHPAVMPRKEPVEQGRAGSTDMQIAGGRRGKADTHARGVLSRLGHFERIFLGRINPSV